MSSNAIDSATGLPEIIRERICSHLHSDPRITSVVLFGSRAKGTWREGSDIDVAVFGSGLDRTDVWTWNNELDADVFPWSLDIVIVDERTDRQLREHISRVGWPLCGRV